VTYHIVVERAGEGNQVALRVDGVSIKGETVPLPGDGRREVLVQATLS
jgi:hypothetical protein